MLKGMGVRKAISTFLLAATAVLVILVSLFPGSSVIGLLVLIRVPGNLPLGINDRSDLEWNFQEQRPALKAVVAAARASDVTSARRGYWSLLGYARPEPRGAEYQQLYRAMRQARVQRFEALSREPFRIQLVTDEAAGFLDTRVYGYVYAEGDSSDNQYFFGSRNRLEQNWYLLRTKL